MIPDHVNPLQWHQSIGVARQSCARVFRDGGSPRDALEAFGIRRSSKEMDAMSWDKVVEQVAEALCNSPMAKAA